MKFFCKTLMALSICASAVANPQIETVIVTADFRDAELLKMPASVSVLSADVIRQRNAQHLEQMLTLAPNVNISSGSSRARFIQIRGIGERSQFAQPIDPSVGLVIDDVDFTGIGAAATMFDVRQVEVLRGPQGIRYGANALAGIVAIQSQQPTENFEGYVDASISEYDTWSLGAAAGGAISDSLLYRVAVQKNTSDGFIENDYLNKDDTNNIDELTSRVKLKWLASEKVTINTSFLFADIDNGYDAFSLDNNRTTLSDEPGHDRQKTRALSIKADVDVSTAINFQTIASYASSDLEYGYDEDWSYVGICSDFPCDGYDYATTDNYKRDRQNGSVELRLLSDEAGRIFNDSTDWLIGVYFSEQSVELDRDYFDWDAFSDANLMSEYDTKNLALFAELSSSLSEKMTLTYGLRIEDWTAEYSDSNAVVLDNDDTLYGGKLVLDYQYADNSMAYASVARGYKAGGVNIDSTLAEINREFDTEFQWAYELGLKNILLDGRLSTRVAVFYLQRDDQQIKSSTIVTDPAVTDPAVTGSPPDFKEYTANAAKGNNYGIEAEADWRVTDSLRVFSSLGWLETKISSFKNPDPDAYNLEGREQAHAPRYQYSLGTQYDFMNNFYVSLALEGKANFYFSDSHGQKSKNYNLVNATIGYDVDQFSVSVWAKNLTDEDYTVRGFGFDNDPRTGNEPEQHIQLAEPRVVGVSARYNF